MNRRNFVVGLGTVATISGVASVTAAQFADDVSPTAEFRVRPEDADLTVDGTDQFDANSEPHWFSSNLTDFNETEQTTSNVTAHIDNSSTDEGLIATLTFNNTNTSAGTPANDVYDPYAHPSLGSVNGDGGNGDGFFQIINNGETDENVGLTFSYGDDTGNAISEGDVADAFQFYMDDGNGTLINVSPIDSGDGTPTTDPENYAPVASGTDEYVSLEIVVSDALYNGIQSESGGAFSETTTSLQLINGVTVGTEEGT